MKTVQPDRRQPRCRWPAARAFAQKGETVKIALIDPLSGLFANVGQNQLKSWQFVAEQFNANNPAGVKFEIVGIDNKLSPQESLNALKAAIDQGVRYIIAGQRLVGRRWR